MNQPNRRKDDALIARIDERLMGLDRSFSQHEVEDHQRFELVFSHIKDRFDNVEKRFDKLDKRFDKLDILWDQSNTNKGTFSASRVVIGVVWSVALLVAAHILNKGA